jgi:hypothetical protein
MDPVHDSLQVRTVAVMLGPLLSISASARAPTAASVISARVGVPWRAISSSTWVAQMQGTWAASQMLRISS